MSNPDGVDHFFQVPTTGRLVSAIACALWGDAFTDARERGEKTQTCARGSPTPLGAAGTAWSVSLRAHIPSDIISFPLPPSAEGADLTRERGGERSLLKRETERLTGSETHPLCREWDGNTPDTQAPHAPKQSTLSKTCPCRAPKQSTCPCRALYARTARAEAVDVPTPSPCCAVQTAGAPVMAEIQLRRTDGWRTGHSRNPVAQYRQLARR